MVGSAGGGEVWDVLSPSGSPSCGISRLWSVPSVTVVCLSR